MKTIRVGDEFNLAATDQLDVVVHVRYSLAPSFSSRCGIRSDGGAL